MAESTVVYDLRAQNLRFIALMPEQIGTPTMHFPQVSGGLISEASRGSTSQKKNTQT